MTCMVTSNSKGQLGAMDLSDSIRAAEVGKTIGQWPKHSSHDVAICTQELNSLLTEQEVSCRLEK